MGRMPWVLVGVQCTSLVSLGLIVGCVADFGPFECQRPGCVDPISEFLRGDVVVWWHAAGDLREVGRKKRCFVA